MRNVDYKQKKLNKKLLQIKQNICLLKINELPEKVKVILTKELTKHLISKSSGFNHSKYFYSKILQKYFVFISVKKCIKYFDGTTRIYW